MTAGKAHGIWTSAMPALVAGLLLANCSAWRPGAADGMSRGQAALRSGDYPAARAAFEEVLKTLPGSEEARSGLLEVLRLTGAYAEAGRRATSFLADGEQAPVILEAGRIAEARGEYEAALARFKKAAASGKGVSVVAARDEARLLEMLGRASDAERVWDGLIDRYRKGSLRGSRDLGAAATAAWRRGFVKDARDLFLDATGGGAAGEASLETLVLFGELFLEKYNARDALGVLRDCLNINSSHPEALLAVARAKRYESNGEAESSALLALKTNPNLVGALNLLAELRLQEEDQEAAMKTVDRALAVNPSDLGALALKAVCQEFRGDRPGFAETERRILALNPSYGELYHVIAENFVMRRKYEEAVSFNRRALEVQPALVAASLDLGVNLTRLGQVDEGRRWIQRTFDADSYNIWAFNTLDLLEQMDKFGSARTGNFLFRMDAEDEAVVSSYAGSLAEEAFGNLTRRYGFVPTGPLLIEMFPDHGGFAVRTLGLPGLGALGVCFGKVIAMDSPRARKAGSFNWGSTLWHEFAHVITLQMTRHNIPRWYSEGISVYEERRARPGWGDDLTLEFARAWKEGKLLKVSELNSGMMRPKFPEQIEFSYYQASLVCELIAERFGFPKIPETLKLFAEGRRPEEVFRAALGWDSATMDGEYAAYLESKVGPVASRFDFKRPGRGDEAKGAGPDRKALMERLERNPDDFLANLELGSLLRKEKSMPSAEQYLRKARDLFPEYTGPGNPHQQLADICVEAGRKDEALEHILAWTRYDENTAPPLVRAAEILRERKEWTRAAEVLGLAVFVNPYDPAVQKGLGEAAVECQRWDIAASAWRAVLGLRTTDPAGAHYNLALALLGAGNRAEARREVLRALEIAPTFEKAHELLLKLVGGAR